MGSKSRLFQVDFKLMLSLKKHPQWQAAEHISEVLGTAGFKSVLAGGCVRDALLGRKPSDLDIATEATPEQVEKLFDKVIPVGKSFGVCRVIVYGQELEIATFREEFNYQDGRRPEEVVYSNMEQDAFRRDFTINAMFYDLRSKQVIDLVQGESDLESGRLRTVGHPEARFAEDYLRILRGVRFAAQLNFEIEPDTYSAMKRFAPKLVNISKDRVQEEFHKAFQCANPWVFLHFCKELEIFKILFKDWQWELKARFPRHQIPRWSAWEHITEKFSKPNTKTEAWANLCLHYIRYLTTVKKNSVDEAFKRAEQWLVAMKLSKKIIKEVMFYFESGDVFTITELLPIENHIKVAGSDYFQNSYNFWNKEWLVLKGENPYSQYWQNFKLEYMQDGKLPEPVISGQDLIARGFLPGPKIKKMLEQAYKEQVVNKIKSKEEILKKII